MLLSYMKDNYTDGMPIFMADIHIDGLSEPNKRQQILVNSHDIVPYKSILNL